MFIAKGLVVPAAAVLAAAVAVAVSQVAATTYVITSLDDDFNYDHVPAKIITGDSFQFIFGGEHNAVAAANNTTCTPLADLTGQLNSGDNPADGYTYTFTKAGVYNFISTKPGECQKGMRASVEVVDGTASSGLTTFKTTKASSDAGEDGSTQPTAAPTATTSSKAAASGSTTASAAASTSSKSAAGGRVGGAMEIAVAGSAAAVVALFAVGAGKKRTKNVTRPALGGQEVTCQGSRPAIFAVFGWFSVTPLIEENETPPGGPTSLTMMEMTGGVRTVGERGCECRSDLLALPTLCEKAKQERFDGTRRSESRWLRLMQIAFRFVAGPATHIHTHTHTRTQCHCLSETLLLSLKSHPTRSPSSASLHTRLLPWPHNPPCYSRASSPQPLSRSPPSWTTPTQPPSSFRPWTTTTTTTTFRPRSSRATRSNSISAANITPSPPPTTPPAPRSPTSPASSTRATPPPTGTTTLSRPPARFTLSARNQITASWA